MSMMPLQMPLLVIASYLWQLEGSLNSYQFFKYLSFD